MAPPLKITDTRRWLPVATRVNSWPQQRSRALLDAVIDQFKVESNPRYEPSGGNTYCNVFAWDFANAMNAILPHWVMSPSGNPALPGAIGAREQLANDIADWLEVHGSRFFWAEVTAEEAQMHANAGRPVVAVWKNTGGVGHVAPVRPGDTKPVPMEGPLLANVGKVNASRVRCMHAFVSAWRSRKVRFWVAP